MQKKERAKLIKERDRIQEKLFCPTPYVYKNFRKLLKRKEFIDFQLSIFQPIIKKYRY